MLLDHINGITADNRIANLREVTRAENCHNAKMRSDNTSGSIGVHKMKSGKFETYIHVNGKKKHLGCFATKEEAQKEYDKAKRELHPSPPWTRIAADAGLPLWKAAS